MDIWNVWKNRSNGSWISSVAVSDTCREKLPHLFLQPSFQSGVLFPNPSNEIVHYDFTLEESLDLKILIYGIDGRLVAILYEDFVKSGPQRLSFDIQRLKAGSYFLVIENNGSSIYIEKYNQKLVGISIPNLLRNSNSIFKIIYSPFRSYFFVFVSFCFLLQQFLL